MATSNHERVGRALDLLNQGLRPFVERELRAAHGDRWQETALAALRDDRQPPRGRDSALNWDTQALLTVMWNLWNEVFRTVLGHAERSLVSELREARNRWAHQEPFSTDDAYRALDSVERLLAAVSADESFEVNKQKQELLRVRFEEQARRETRRAAVAPTAGQPQAGLRPWREIATPHPDVASGRYQQAEFAADLAQVHRGEGGSEYGDPQEFFARTFLTKGLHHLLVGALRRLAGAGGDPVVELQTNFGGGKTHSLLALYHLFSGAAAADLAGVEPILQEAGVGQPPRARRAILVGTALSPAQPRRKPDGTEVCTLWGELAWQLGDRDGYSLVAEADRRGVSPGSDVLHDLFTRFGPCLILIDELVAFVRQLYHVQSLAAGSFDANMSFAQALTEAAHYAPQTLVVATLPKSDIEIGGEGGDESLRRLRNVVGRVESPWRPASTDEGFEIVRRRLFQTIAEPQAFVARDAVVRAFGDLYRGQSGEFPSECREADYERRLKAAYPIHPELFHQLYGAWSTLDRFQQTRGVLRLMATVIHTLWERDDRSLVILPGSVPIDEPSVQFELTRYLEDPWVPVIEKDVDGPYSLPLQLDRENPNLGRYSAARRVARTLYLGSAPTLRASNRGIDDARIKLGCAQPGESVATFGDALRRLTDQATHIYVDGRRYWYSTQPSVTRLARDRAERLDADTVSDEIKRRVRADASARGDFRKVHPAPASGADVPDDDEARLVILGPEHPHAGRSQESQARAQAAEILDRRGGSPRIYRNMVVFLAADRTRLAELDQAVRGYLAWKSIEDDRERLNLDPFQASQAKAKRESAEETIRQRLPEAYQWLLVPEQPSPPETHAWAGRCAEGSASRPVPEEPSPPKTHAWREIRLQGDGPLAVRASKKLRNEGLLVGEYGAVLLRNDLDRIPLWRGDHVTARQLWEDYARYLYLARLCDGDVLLKAVQAGAMSLTWEAEAFAYAEGWDEARSRYLGLRAGAGGSVVVTGLIVHPQAARRQLDQVEAETRAQAAKTGTPPATCVPATSAGYEVADGGAAVAPASKGVAPAAPTATYRRFHGSVELDPARAGRDAGRIADEVIAHLVGLVGAKVKVTIEIEAALPDGAPDHVVRTVTENCRTLKFSTQGFEER
ncbi:MAG: ATP-binding protein [Chloroflexi bacterium]|nr:ATP-binding protein [Chloroflexota bacterium]